VQASCATPRAGPATRTWRWCSRAALPLDSPRLRDHAVGLLLCARGLVQESSPLDEEIVALLVAAL